MYIRVRKSREARLEIPLIYLRTGQTGEIHCVNTTLIGMSMVPAVRGILYVGSCRH
jgi:hypothetical protein